MKTASEWFERLPKFVAKNAIAYLRRRPELKGKEFDSFKEALKAGFDWRATKEGEEFWQDIYNEPDKFIMSESKKIETAKFWTGQSVLVSKKTFHFENAKNQYIYYFEPWKEGEIRVITEDAICVRVPRFWGKQDIWIPLGNEQWKITPIQEV